MSARDLQCLRGNNYAFVDIETTGANTQYSRIIEIAIIRVEDGFITETFSSLINPEISIPSFISSITGITDVAVAASPIYSEVALDIERLLDKAIFVAHNARFDYGFIKSEFKRLGITLNAKTLCIVKVSRQIFPEQRGHSLENIIRIHNLDVEERHRALADTKAMIQFLQAVEQNHSPDIVADGIKRALANYILPATIDEKIIAKLPHKAGVYFFYDANDSVLYVGKSVDIKNRVRSHFSQSHISNKEQALTTNVTHIDYEETTGELSALLKEAHYIKTLMPEYNRRLRKTTNLAVFSSMVTTMGYKTGTLSYVPSDSILDHGSVEGIFRTIRSGTVVLEKIVTEHELCSRLLGLEKGRGACFKYQLGQCRGACSGNESPENYNERFESAFKKIKLKSWPFKGPVTIVEDPDAEEGTAYSIDQWKIKKVINYTAEGSSEEDIELPFDFDTYKILSKHILKKNVKVM